MFVVVMNIYSSHNLDVIAATSRCCLLELFPCFWSWILPLCLYLPSSCDARSIKFVVKPIGSLYYLIEWSAAFKCKLLVGRIWQSAILSQTDTFTIRRLYFWTRNSLSHDRSTRQISCQNYKLLVCTTLQGIVHYGVVWLPFHPGCNCFLVFDQKQIQISQYQYISSCHVSVFFFVQSINNYYLVVFVKFQEW